MLPTDKGEWKPPCTLFRNCTMRPPERVVLTDRWRGASQLGAPRLTPNEAHRRRLMFAKTSVVGLGSPAIFQATMGSGKCS